MDSQCTDAKQVIVIYCNQSITNKIHYYVQYGNHLQIILFQSQK